MPIAIWAESFLRVGVRPMPRSTEQGLVEINEERLLFGMRGYLVKSKESSKVQSICQIHQDCPSRTSPAVFPNRSDELVEISSVAFVHVTGLQKGLMVPQQVGLGPYFLSYCRTWLVRLTAIASCPCWPAENLAAPHSAR
jgi:hypothetical protein